MLAHLLRTAYLLTTVLQILQRQGPCTFRNWCCGDPSLQWELKIETLEVQTLCSSERSWELGVPSQLFVTVSGIECIQECVSVFPTCFNICIFSFSQCVGLTGLVSEFLSEGSAPCFTVHSVSVEGRKFRSLLCLYPYCYALF